MLQEGKIGFIGGGNMAEALIKGLTQGMVDSARIQVAEPDSRRREYLVERYGVKVAQENHLVAADCDMLIFAVKPQLASAVLAGIADVITTEKLCISIMAGISALTIESAFQIPVRVVRAMPNTPAVALQGATAIAQGSFASSQDMDAALSIFKLVGKCWQVEERLLDAVTGLSGSGPAYVMTFVEALSDAGLKNGLPRDTAYGLALQTVLGTACLMAETGDHPAVLREKVTSPGGTTIAGLQALEVGGFRGTVMRGVDAATARSAELGKKQ